MMIAWKKLYRKFTSFAVARGGNVVITFALATLPILGFVGAAVDYSRANSMKAAMQTALDSTALMLSKEASTDTEDQLKANALKYFTALFNRSEAQNIAINVAYNTDGGSKVVISATAQLPADFTKILGYDMFNVNAQSTSKWGITRLRVALVLDNTGSMADDGKMPALQSATQGLLTQLQGAVTTAGDVYVSIVPFVKDVNVGATAYNSTWIYWGTAAQDPGLTDNASWDANNGNCNNGSWATRTNCITKGGSCSNNSYTTQSTCLSHGNCSIGGNNTSQSTCNSAGTCSIAGNNSQSSCTSAGTCSLNTYTTQSTCIGAGTCSISGHNSQSSCQSAHVCSLSQYGSQNQCRYNGGTWMAGVWTSNPGTWTAGTWTPATFTAYVWTPGVWTPKNHNVWNGCVSDRGYPASPSNLGGLSGPDTTFNFDTNADAPDPITPRWSSLYPAEQYGSCPQAVKSLSYDWSSMSSLVTAMSPAGNTNQAIGLQLGWMSLVGGGPFTAPPLDPAYQYTQVIILLTDGLNTQNRWSTTQSDIDGREQMTCDNIKAAGIQMYTIQVNTGGDPTSTLLQNCASDASKFFLLTSAGQMTATFNTIGTNLTKLRVAQ
jgi:Flp pilus assembly protein TadG